MVFNGAGLELLFGITVRVGGRDIVCFHLSAAFYLFIFLINGLPAFFDPYALQGFCHRLLSMEPVTDPFGIKIMFVHRDRC